MATIVESVLARSYAFVVVGLRYLIVGGWAAAVVLAVMFLPPLSAASSGGLSNLIPSGSAAAHAESDVAELEAGDRSHGRAPRLSGARAAGWWQGGRGRRR